MLILKLTTEEAVKELTGYRDGQTVDFDRQRAAREMGAAALSEVAALRREREELVEALASVAFVYLLPHFDDCAADSLVAQIRDRLVKLDKVARNENGKYTMSEWTFSHDSAE